MRKQKNIYDDPSVYRSVGISIIGTNKIRAPLRDRMTATADYYERTGNGLRGRDAKRAEGYFRMAGALRKRVSEGNTLAGLKYPLAAMNGGMDGVPAIDARASGRREAKDR